MNWQIFLLISVIATGLSSIYQKKILNIEKIHSIAFAIGFQLFVSLLVGCLLLFYGFNFSHLWLLLPNFILMIALYAVGNLCRYGSIKRVDISRYTILFQINVIVSVIASYVLLREQLGLFQIIGILLVFSGALIVLWKKKFYQLHKGDWLAVASALIYGIAFVTDAVIVQTFDPLTFVFLAFLGPGVMLAIIFPKKLIEIKTLFVKKARYNFFMASLLTALSAASLYTAYRIGRNAAQLASLSQFSAVLTVLLGIIVLKEKKSISGKIIGIILSTIGVLLLL